MEKLLERNTIEVAPLAFMRGRTLNDSFIIMDEAQNATPEQMKMALTRQGFNSKMVVTGDITQIDLPYGQRSGLIEVIDVLRGVDGIRFVQFDDRDVVRHSLVQKIVRAYERYNQAIGADRQLSLKLSEQPAEPPAEITAGSCRTGRGIAPRVTRGPCQATRFAFCFVIRRGNLRRGPLREFLADLARRAAPGRAVNCLITTDRELRAMNRRFLRKDYATDVLSFPVREWRAGRDRDLLGSRRGASCRIRPLDRGRSPYSYPACDCCI